MQIIDPDGRIVQRASGQETVVTEILDLDRVTRTREFGTLGMTQSLKSLRDSRVNFPQYQGEFARSEAFKKLKSEGT